MPRISWIVQQIVPPALLTYFAVAGKICITEIGPYIGTTLGRPVIGKLYSATAVLLVGSCTILYIRLYFLPSNQSVPPQHPPLDLLKDEVFECLSPEAARIALEVRHNFPGWDESVDEVPGVSHTTNGGVREEIVVLDRCWKGTCSGRWKPPRARHCSECGKCRMGFDHHCALFANCFTAPHIPTFLSLLLLTPLTILLLSSPILPLLAGRFCRAWSLACTSPAIAPWWAWKPAWIICGGPVGRYVGGLILGWRELDRISPEPMGRWSVGALAAIGAVLGLICTALGYTTAIQVLSGTMSVDRERAKSFARTAAAIRALQERGKPIPDELEGALRRYADIHHFYVPWDGSGRIVELRPAERPYDLGPRGNWDLIMGRGWGWVLPWVALQRGMSREQLMRWPISTSALEALRRQAGELGQEDDA